MRKLQRLGGVFCAFADCAEWTVWKGVYTTEWDAASGAGLDCKGDQAAAGTFPNVSCHFKGHSLSSALTSGCPITHYTCAQLCLLLPTACVYVFVDGQIRRVKHGSACYMVVWAWMSAFVFDLDRNKAKGRNKLEADSLACKRASTFGGLFLKMYLGVFYFLQHFWKITWTTKECDCLQKKKSERAREGQIFLKTTVSSIPNFPNIYIEIWTWHNHTKKCSCLKKCV